MYCNILHVNISVYIKLLIRKLLVFVRSDNGFVVGMFLKQFNYYNSIRILMFLESPLA